MPGMRARTFNAGEIIAVATRFKVQAVELSITWTKRLRAHPRDLTLASHLAACKRGLT
jgi:hypothetical protein